MKSVSWASPAAQSMPSHQRPGMKARFLCHAKGQTAICPTSLWVYAWGLFQRYKGGRGSSTRNKWGARMKVIGINSFFEHPSVALMVDGEIVFAIEDERLTRVKHGRFYSPYATYLPYDSIYAALKYAGLQA